MFDFLWAGFLGCVVLAAIIDLRQLKLVDGFDKRIDKEVLRRSDDPIVESMERSLIIVLFCQFTPIWNIVYSWKRLKRVKRNIKKYQHMLDGNDMSNQN